MAFRFYMFPHKMRLHHLRSLCGRSAAICGVANAPRGMRPHFPNLKNFLSPKLKLFSLSSHQIKQPQSPKKNFDMQMTLKVEKKKTIPDGPDDLYNSVKTSTDKAADFFLLLVFQSRRERTPTEPRLQKW